MPGTEGNSNQREALKGRTRADKKMQAANREGDGGADGSVANAIAQNVTEKISALMELKFAELQSSLQGLSNRIDENANRITDAETRISECDDRTISLERKVAELEKIVKAVDDRVLDAENRSRRSNLRITGLKEGTEGTQVVEFFETWLPEVLGLETKHGRVKIDRAHRGRAPVPRRQNYIRPVILKLHNFRDKARILAAVRDKEEILYEGKQVYIRQDLSPRVKDARRQFNTACQELIKKKVLFQMRFPATLQFSLDGKEYSFESAKEAEEFLKV